MKVQYWAEIFQHISIKTWFLQKRFEIADFNSDGKTPVAKEEFTRSAITGARTGSRSCKRLAGIGSRIQVALEDLVTISVISKAFVALKHSNLDLQGVSNDSTGGQNITSIEFSNSASNALILAIFVTKKLNIY